MLLHRRLETGAEEWHCPTCGRRMLLLSLPESGTLDVNVLEAGERGVGHWGGMDGMELVATVVPAGRADSDLRRGGGLAARRPGSLH
jgi:hypothetical protein